MDPRPRDGFQAERKKSQVGPVTWFLFAPVLMSIVPRLSLGKCASGVR